MEDDNIQLLGSTIEFSDMMYKYINARKREGKAGYIRLEGVIRDIVT